MIHTLVTETERVVGLIGTYGLLPSVSVIAQIVQVLAVTFHTLINSTFPPHYILSCDIISKDSRVSKWHLSIMTPWFPSSLMETRIH